MSFLFGAKPQLSSAQKIANAETEMELIADMYKRLQESCTKKCIPPEYREGELNKGESVCLDRCAAKFFEINMKVSEKMQAEQARQGGGVGFGGL